MPTGAGCVPVCCLPADVASTSGRRFVIPRNEIPVDLLVARHDPRKVPSSAICTTAELRQAHRDSAWAGKREYLIAGAAAGLHVAMFAWNLAFWGFEGMPPDRCVTQMCLLSMSLFCSQHCKPDMGMASTRLHVKGCIQFAYSSKGLQHITATVEYQDGALLLGVYHDQLPCPVHQQIMRQPGTPYTTNAYQRADASCMYVLRERATCQLGLQDITDMQLPAVAFACCRYWPDNPRIKLGLRPGRYGHMAGAKKLWYNYLELFEGGGAPKK